MLERVGERHRDRPVELDTGEGMSHEQPGVEQRDLRPVGLGACGAPRSPPAPGTGPAAAASSARPSRRRPSSISAASHSDRSWSASRTSSPAGVTRASLRESWKSIRASRPERLGLVGHQHAEELRQPDRLAAEVVPDMRLARRCGVALVEDEVEHRQDGPQAGLAGGGRAARGTGCRPSGSSASRERAAAPSPARRRGTRARSPRGQTADLAQGQRDLRVGGERRVAAREDERQPVVRDRAHRLLLGREVSEPGQQLRLAGERPLTPDAIDRPVPGGGDDPGAGVARQRRPAATAPGRLRTREDLGDRVAEDAVPAQPRPLAAGRASRTIPAPGSSRPRATALSTGSGVSRCSPSKTALLARLESLPARTTR